jgi:hypothetical protein
VILPPLVFPGLNAIFTLKDELLAAVDPEGARRRQRRDDFVDDGVGTFDERLLANLAAGNGKSGFIFLGKKEKFKNI